VKEIGPAERLRVGDEGVERRRSPGVAEGKTMEVEAFRREIQDLREELEKLRKRASDVPRWRDGAWEAERMDA
jgi:hypothetical protein